MTDLISRDAAIAALSPMLRSMISRGAACDAIRANLAAVPAQVKSGPQIAGYTCKGCANFHSEYWSEPSGDGETYDSGTSAKCRATDRNISTYYGSAPTTPDWCPASALEPQPDPRDAVIAQLVEALDSLLEAITATTQHGDRSLTITGATTNLKWLLEAEEDARAALAAAKKGLKNE